MSSASYWIAAIGLLLGIWRLGMLFRRSVNHRLATRMIVESIQRGEFERIDKMLTVASIAPYAAMLRRVIDAWKASRDGERTYELLDAAFRHEHANQSALLKRTAWVAWVAAALALVSGYLALAGDHLETTALGIAGVTLLAVLWSARMAHHIHYHSLLEFGAVVTALMELDREERAGNEHPHRPESVDHLDQSDDLEVIGLWSRDLTTVYRVHEPSGRTRQQRFCQMVIKVGKLRSSHLRVDDDTASRMHAVIEVKPDPPGAPQVLIVDLGSTRGTWVNGTKVDKAALMPGDRITVGQTTIEFVGWEVGN